MNKSKITLQEAYELCIIKWEAIVENNGIKPSQIKGLEILENSICDCGYCHYYNSCSDCPLLINEIGDCCELDHPWTIWLNNQTKENAQAVLQLIRDTKPF